MKTSETPLTRHLVQSGVFSDAAFGFVDVGASGGVDPRWSVFGSQLRAWGFDPLIGEMERLNALGTSNVEYRACQVGFKGYEELLQATPFSTPERPELTNDPGSRLSLWKAITPEQSVEHYDRSGSMRRSSTRVDLDDFFQVDARAAIDFIKTDTDGQDYEVLLGAAGLLREGPVIGVEAECILHGRLHPHVQVFANLDSFMREAGFSLFDLSAWRYTRSALPGRFVWGVPGPTEKGQPWWGDFLYLRDLGDPAYEDNWSLRPSALKILKLVCCFESYDLADCAAEVILKYQARLAPLVDVERCLDLLTPTTSQDGQGISYREYMRRFGRDPKAFVVGAS